MTGPVIRGRSHISTTALKASHRVAMEKDSSGDALGFRVVHEAGFQSYRGTSHSNLPTEGRRGELPTALSHELLSFRLVREDT